MFDITAIRILELNNKRSYKVMHFKVIHTKLQVISKLYKLFRSYSYKVMHFKSIL